MIETALLIGKMAGVITAVSGAFFVLFKIGKSLVSAVGIITSTGTAVGEIKEDLSSLSSRMSTVEREITRNGGGTVKDAIERIESTLFLLNQSNDHMLSDSGVASFSTDHEGNYTSVNSTYAQLMGRPVDECLGYGWVNCLASGEAEEAVEAWEGSVEDERHFYRDVSYVRPDGVSFRARVQAFALRDKQGKFVGHRGFVRRQP